MKKIILLALAVASTLSVSAEGYQVNTLSAKQLGMGHTSVSQKLNSESVWFNPAAAAYQEQKFSIAAGVTGIMATATCTIANDYTNPTTTYTSDNDWSTPLYLYANYKVTDNLALGLSFNTPYGSSMNWGDSWGGAHLVQNIKLTSYTAQPTISYKMLDGKLSVGAGLMMTWGNFSLSKSMMEVGATSNSYLQYIASYLGSLGAMTSDEVAAATSAIEAVGNNPLASATLSGDAGLKMGFNVGVMYDINDQWSLGASYRSKMVMAVDAGETEIDYANAYVQAIFGATGSFDFMTDNTFSAELPLPATLSIGATYYPTDKWTLSTEVQWVHWSDYDALDIDFQDAVVTYNKNYSNTIIARFGAQYEALDWMTARLGFYVDQSPVASDYLNPETPSMTKVGYTCGASFMPVKSNRNFSIDLAYAYISSADPERAGSYPLYSTDGSLESVFSANYTTKAHTASIGLSWGF